MKPVWLGVAAVVAVALALRWRREGWERRLVALAVIAAAAVYGTGLVHLPKLEQLIEDVGTTLGTWTYLLVGVMAFLETGAFVGLVAPGEVTIIVGGVVAGQGQIDLVPLIALVWGCAIAGDVTSYWVGRRLGRDFLVRHGPRVQITEERLVQVEGFFERHGGKAILIGRFVGIVRAIAPFIAGASRMPFRRFVPYDVIGAGLWGTTFVVLGFVFWHSFDQVIAIAKRGAFALGTVIVVIVGAVVAYRFLRVPENRATAHAWLHEQAERPQLAPLARVVRPLWWDVLAPLGRRLAGPARFAWQRLTPGDLGLELTTLLAAVAVGSFAFLGLAFLVGGEALHMDRVGFTLAGHLHGSATTAIAKALTTLGSLYVVGPLALIATVALAVQRRWAEGAALAAGTCLTVAAVHVAKAVVDRPRPSGALVETLGQSYPSGHAAYALGLVAIAVALRHALRSGGIAPRFALVGGAVALALLVGATRVYLRAHYVSDVLGGWGLAATIYGLCGMAALIVAFVRHNGARADP